MADMGKKQQGLTLIELMVTLAVAIILVAVGMPLFSGIAANNRATTQTNALVTALNLARSEAVGRGADVSIRAAGGTWKQGWVVFVDDDEDGVVDDGEPIRVWAPLSNNATVTVIADDAVVVFDSFGAADAAYTFQLGQDGATGSATRCVVVGLTGQIRSSRQSCS